MVKKLFKYEFRAFAKVLLPFFGLTLLASIFGRIALAFGDADSIIALPAQLSVALYPIIGIICFIAPIVYSVIRFYKNLFSKEGYLTFSLPVTATQHILVKFVTAFAFVLAAYIVVFTSTLIMMIGEPLDVVVRIIDSLFSTDLLMQGDGIAFTIEYTILIIVGAASQILLLFGCITVGQMSKSSRIGSAVGAYFIYQFATQILSSLLLLGAIAINELTDGIVERFTEQNPMLVIHITLITLIVGTIGFCFMYFFIMRYIMTKKLNLE